MLVILIAVVMLAHPAHAQLWKRIKKEVQNRAQNHVVNDAGDVTDNVIDKTEDAAVKAVANKNGDKNDSKEANNSDDRALQPAPPSQSVPADVTPAQATESQASLLTPPPTTASYKNYDFVPGDKIIFETDLRNQQDAELPARLGTLNGTAEVQTYQGEKVLHLGNGNPVCIIPMVDSTNYLPGQFTVEFDFLYNDPNPASFNQIEANFYQPDKSNDYMKSNGGDYHFLVYEAAQLDFGPSIAGKELPEALIEDLKVPDKWHHVAIYVHDNVGKAYIDQYRVAASNMMPKGAVKLAIKTNGRMEYMIRNFRIAGGGSDAYHKIMTDGKLVTHGIHFASGKADILPESMGTINEVYTILKDHPELNFEIDGYTDNDGSADLNEKLSQQRADAVRGQLITMGIDKSRLTTKGMGESKPIDSNDTPEGKANNRRVEFVKQ